MLSVASELLFTTPAYFRRATASLAERIQAELDAPVLAGLHSLAASTLGAERPPYEDAFVCGDDPEAKALALELAEHLTPAARSTPARRRRPGSRRLTAVIVNLNRRYKGHAGIRVTGLA